MHSEKTSAYQFLLSFCLPILRNRLKKRWQSRKARSDSFEIAQLLHHIPPLLQEEQVGRGDEYFLRVGFLSFFERYSAKEDPLYAVVADEAEKLFRLVETKLNLEWQFPDSAVDLAINHRKLQASLD